MKKVSIIALTSVFLLLLFASCKGPDNPAVSALSYSIIKGAVTPEGAGSFTVSKMTGIAKDELITLTVSEEAGYRFNAWSVSGAMVNPERDAGNRLTYTFLMPPRNITINAVFIPWEAGFAVSADESTGSFTFLGLEDGEAQAGDTVIVLAKPNPGYKLVNNNPISSPAIEFFRTLDSLWNWTFIMPAENVSLSFAPLSDLELYKGGAKTGLHVAPLEEYPWYHTIGTTEWAPGTMVVDWDSNIELNADYPGRSGNPRAIKVGPSPVNVDSGFALAFDTEFDMSRVKALSFWAKTDGAQGVNIKRVGFGDAGEYAVPYGYCATHRGVLYTGEANNNVNPVTAQWKRFIVPVPAGITAPDMKRVFTIIATLQAGSNLYIDDIEFLESGITCTGIRVPASVPNKYYPGVPADVSSLFEDAAMSWEFKLDEDNSTYRIYFVSDGGWYHLTGWQPDTYKKFTIDSIEGNAVISSGTEITGESYAEVSLVLKNGQGIKTNPISIVFDSGYLLIIDDFETGAGSFNANGGRGYWHTGGEYAAGFSNEAGESHEGKQGAWWDNYRYDDHSFGRNNVDFTVTGFDNISFWVKSNATDSKFTFTLNNSQSQKVEFSVNAVDIWEKKAFTLAELGLDSGDAHITSWRFDWVTAGGNSVSLPTLRTYIDYITASKIPYGGGILDIEIDFDADFSGFPEGITLYKSGDGLRQLEISLVNYSDAQWFIDGTWVFAGGAYTLKAADWSRGSHSLTMMVTVDGAPYAKKVSFTVER